MTQTATKPQIKAGAVFGYRKVVEVTRDSVTYINTNGRKPEGRRRPVAERAVTVSLTAFRAMIGA